MGGSLENFILARNFQSRSKSRMFLIFGPSGFVNNFEYDGMSNGRFVTESMCDLGACAASATHVQVFFIGNAACLAFTLGWRLQAPALRRDLALVAPYFERVQRAYPERA